MSSFEWIELESLSLEISNAEARLAEALAGNLVHVAKDVETQIANAKARRERLVEAISQNAASLAISEGAAGQMVEIGEHGLPELPADDVIPAEVISNPVTQADPTPVAPVGQTNDGAARLWEQLGSRVLARATQDLQLRRSAMLARHAEELKVLEAEQDEIEALEQAIAAFARKSARQPEGGDIVQLDEERDLRQHHNHG